MGHQNLHFRMGITQILALGLLFLGQGCQSLSHKRGADPDVAIQHFEENMGPAKKCADDLVAMKQDKEGRVTIEWTVNDKGETLHPKVTENSWKDPEAEIKYKKWLRYLAGPGVAMAATLVNLPSQSSGALSDYMLLILPSVGVGVTTVLLEIQFAWPYLNNVFWKHVWKFGGRVMGRVTNIFVNFLYGMSLYGAGVGAAQLPVLFGGNPIAFTHLPFLDAVVAAAVGGLTFHLAMGQFQTDISLEEEHGAIRGSNRYGLETTGAVINNGARVLDWVVPAGLGTWAQMGFFALKTLPQMLKTNFATKIADRRVKEQLRSHQDKPKSWRSRCISAIQSLELINLPKLRK